MSKLRDAKTNAERAAAMLLTFIEKNSAYNARVRAQGKEEKHFTLAELGSMIQPFLDLAEIQAQKTEVSAGKVIGVALREKSLHDLKERETKALFDIAELIRRAETPLDEGAASA